MYFILKQALLGNHIVSISAGNYHSFALGIDGTLFGWGLGSHGELGLIDMPAHIQCPIKVPLSLEHGKLIGVSAGESHSVLWTDTGYLLGTGMNKYGQLALSLPRVAEFSQLPVLGCTVAACGSNHTIALLNV